MLTPAHAKYLEDHAVNVELAELLGVRSVTEAVDLPPQWRRLGPDAVPALIYPWTHGDRTVLQLCCDKEVADPDTGEVARYRFTSRARGGGAALWTVYDPPNPTEVLLVEGSKQALAVASLGGTRRIVGLPGCHSWLQDGVPIPQLDDLALGLPLTVLLDADQRTNAAVWKAAKDLEAQLPAVTGCSQYFTAVALGVGSAGIDDGLGKREPDRRVQWFENVLDQRVEKIKGSAPRPKPKDDYGPLAAAFDSDGNFRPMTAAKIIDRMAPVAWQTAANVVYRYGETTGVFTPIPDFDSMLAAMVGDRLQNGMAARVAACIKALAEQNGRVIDALAEPSRLIPLANGVLNPLTGEFSDHSPDHLLLSAWSVAYDPDAKCPTIERYLGRHIPGQVDVFLDAACWLLERRSQQSRAPFLFGPTRSGKSTILRLLVNMVGLDATSAETLADINDSRFSSAELFGKALNVAADLSSAEIQNTSAFKALTGGDQVSAQRKFGHPFKFIGRALMAFSANEVMQMPAGGDAEFRRFVPICAPVQFDTEDPSIEDALMLELPGLLNELLRRYLKRRAQPMDVRGLPVVAAEFRRRADRVAKFTEEVLEPLPVMTGTVKGALLSDVVMHFDRWAFRQGMKPLGKPKVEDALDKAGFPKERSNGTRIRATIRNSPIESGTEFLDWVERAKAGQINETTPSEQGLDSLDSFSKKYCEGENKEGKKTSLIEEDFPEPVLSVQSQVRGHEPVPSAAPFTVGQAPRIIRNKEHT